MNSIITRPSPASVTFDLTHPAHTTITLPPDSTWSSGLHFHASHDEYLVVRRGSVRVRRDSQVQIVTVRPGHVPIEVAIPRGVRHEWERAPAGSIDSDSNVDREEVVVVERTDPADGDKTVFFWNLNGVILQQPPRWMPAGRLWAWWVTLQLFVIFAELDNVPVMLDVKGLVARARLDGVAHKLVGEARAEKWARRADESLSRLVLWVVYLVGLVLGVKAVRREFTPEEVYKGWRTNKEERGKESLRLPSPLTKEE